MRARSTCSFVSALFLPSLSSTFCCSLLTALHFLRLIHLEEMRLKAKQDLLRREMSKEADATDRGRYELQSFTNSRLWKKSHPCPLFFLRAAKERNQAQLEISRENLKKQREEQERHRLALIEKLQAKYGQIEGEPVFLTKM